MAIYKKVSYQKADVDKTPMKIKKCVCEGTERYINNSEDDHRGKIQPTTFIISPIISLSLATAESTFSSKESSSPMTNLTLQQLRPAKLQKPPHVSRMLKRSKVWLGELLKLVTITPCTF
jgi:hypothetical protein